MKNVFNVSLCKNGILGGLLYIKESEMQYCTNKLTVAPKYRRLSLPFDEIQNVQKDSWHTVLISMKNGEMFRFLVFSRNRFLKRMEQITT